MRIASSTQERIREQVQAAATATLNLLFPPHCVVCGRSGSELCSGCCDEFTPLGSLVCPICAEPHNSAGRCRRCAREPRAFRRVQSAFRYEGTLRKVIHAFKYRRRRRLLKPMVERMVAAVQRPGGDNVLLCPVPLHPDRELERGYNQSELLAEELSSYWHLDLIPHHGLGRIRPTLHQVGQDYTARQANMVGAFAADAECVRGHGILLVDDVCTTGATLHACAQTLLDAGALWVEGVTVARAGSDDTTRL